MTTDTAPVRLVDELNTAPRAELVTTTGDMDMPARLEYAKVLAKSDLLPRQFQEHPGNVLWAIEFGDVLGLAPVIAMQQIHVIDHKPSAAAIVIAAMIRKAGHRLRIWTDVDDKGEPRATATLVRCDDPDFEYRAVWDMDRAREAKLDKKDNWLKDRRAMLKARVTSEIGREGAPEAMLGITYTPEELLDSAGAEPAVEKPAHRPGMGVREATGMRVEATVVRDGKANGTGGGAGPGKDSPGTSEGPGSTPASAPAPPSDMDDEPISDKQLRALNTALSAHGLTKRGDRLAYCSKVLAEPVDSTGDLTSRQASRVMDALDDIHEAEVVDTPADKPAGTDERSRLIRQIADVATKRGLTADELRASFAHRHGGQVFTEADLADLSDFLQHLTDLAAES